MIGLLSGLLLLTFSGQPEQILEFKEVEYELSKDLGKGVYTQCSQPLSSVAYAFAVKETGNGAGLKQANKNNLFGLRHGSNKTYNRPKYQSYDVKKHTPNGYNIYWNRRDSIYDFMYQFYKKGCKVTDGYIKGHLNGPNGGNKGVVDYRNTINKLIKKYNTSFKFEFRAMIKPKNVQQYLSEIQKLKNFQMEAKDKGYTYEEGCTIVIDSKNNVYEVRKKR